MNLSPKHPIFTDCNLAIASIMNRAVSAGRDCDREQMFSLCSDAAQVEVLRDYLRYNR